MWARADAMFGDYEIIETVGQGGMGIVYRAHDMALGRIVALKVLKDDLRSSRQICARFQREAEAFASLNHPNIVHIYTVGSVGRIPFIAMEYIDGDPLSTIMKRRKRLPWKRALHIGQQIAEALACAHEAHIIHRDIKPGNIIVDKDDRAFVTDFGIAKVLTAETQLTVDGSRLGTPQYMSPERCMNREITTSSDLYSLGVLIFQMISGRLPYEASSPVELIKCIVSDPPKRLSEYLPDVPKDVERLVAFTIEKEPRNRPSDAQNLADLMQRVIEGKPLHEGDTGLAESLESFRDSMSTPLITSTPEVGGPSKAALLRRRIAERWSKLPEGVRVNAVGGAIIAIAMLAGFGTADILNSGYAVETVRSMNLGKESWNRSAVVADFIQESEGVQLIRINLPSYAVSHATFLGNDHAAVQVTSTRNPWGSQSALCVLDLTEQTAWLGISPKMGTHSQPAFSLLGDLHPSADAREASLGYFFSRDLITEAGGTDPAVFSSPGTEGASIKPQVLFKASNLINDKSNSVPARIAAVALGSRHDSLLMAVAAGKEEDTWGLLEYSPGEGGMRQEARELDAPGPPIEWIHTVSGEREIRYLRRPSKGAFQLWLVNAITAPNNRKLLYEGAGTLLKAGMDPTGRYLAVVAGEGCRASLRLVDLNGETQEIDLGPATSAVWHPSGDYLILTAPDPKGSLQLWALRTRKPYDRAQLTFLSDGTSDLCLVSPSGAWAISSAAGLNVPTLAIVDTSKSRLDTLSFGAAPKV